jgi:hypothetical protein
MLLEGKDLRPCLEDGFKISVVVVPYLWIFFEEKCTSSKDSRR